MSFFYISNPYNGTEVERESRARIAARACAIFLKNGVHAWSPIVHNHAMMKVYNNFTLEERQTLMLDFDFSLLAAAKAMVVLEIPGWNKSFGVKAELDLARRLGIPIHYLDVTHPEFEKAPLSVLRDQPLALVPDALRA